MKGTMMTTIAVIVVLGCGYGGHLWAAESHTPGTDIWTAASTGNLEAIEEHAKAGTDMNIKAPTINLTPLMVAAITGQREVVDLLLGKGAKPDIRNNEGSTALHMAAFFGHIEIVKALLEQGAEINIRNVRSETPYDTVKGAWDEGLERLYLGSAKP